jgi:hypothetical protein
MLLAASIMSLVYTSAFDDDEVRLLHEDISSARSPSLAVTPSHHHTTIKSTQRLSCSKTPRT